MSSILNASPQVINLGIQDLSTRVVTPEAIEIPQHLPKVFMFAKKGTTIPTLTIGAPMLLQYGAESFDPKYKWFNHATKFATAMAGAANTLMIQRVIPDDAGPESNVIIYADVLATTVPNYLRNSDGAYVIDIATNSYKVDPLTPTIAGVKIKYVRDHKDAASLVLGMATSATGTMVDDLGNPSTMYPIMEFKAKYQGLDYNNLGISITNMIGTDIDSRITSATNALTYKLSLVTRKTPLSKYEIVPSLYNEPSVLFSLREKAINPLTEARFDIEAVFDQNWFNETDVLLPLRYNQFEGMKVYRSNIELVLGMITANEKNYVSATTATWEDGNDASTLTWFDYTSDTEVDTDAGKYLTNLFTCKSSKNVNYFTAVIDDTTPVLTGNRKEISISSTTPVFLDGGSDGTLSDANFELLVQREMQAYLDADSRVMDNAVNVESVIYDSGFSLDTKKELCNFIALRKDTAVALSTHTASLGEKYLPLSDQRAIAVALKTRLKLTPESEYFGTPVTRGIVVAGTGLMPDNSSKDEVSLLYSIAIKSAQFMGAGNGRWNGVYAFDRAPGNIIKELKDVKPDFIPAGIKPTLWNDGIVWAQPYDRRQYHFPAVQTVYQDDTSVLNSWTTVMAAITLTKIGDDAWRNFTGSTDLSEAELAEKIVDFVNKATQNKFDGRIVVIPEVQFTAADKQRGYSWRLVNKLYASNMKSVMVYVTQSNRLSDLTL